MNAHLKVQPHHLERSAYLYIRQSSMRQVVENAESAKRQYALRGRAVALGWRDEQIIVIDNDQGESGASAAWREGFQRLVSDVGMGRAGIVMGLEVSRLARNNADWQRLLEICALADTLILDEDGVYDPAGFNDRLLLGLKGTMSEAELHVIKARLRGGILNKARRGEFISWEQHQQNLKILKTNSHGYDVARASIPREGPALLQGRAVCGQCGRHFRVRYAARRGRQEAWYICDRAHASRGEPLCQSIAGPAVDAAIGRLITEQMTPAAVELVLDIRKEIEARQQEADRLRGRAVERAQIEADLAQRRFLLVDPNNRLVADTLEREWNEKLRILANAREDRERAREHDPSILDEAIRARLVAMTLDFSNVWANPDTPNRERKRLLAHIIEDVTLVKLPEEGTTKIHVRFKGGKIETLTIPSPKSSAQQVKTQPGTVELIDRLLDDHIYSEIAELLNQQEHRPGEAARRGRHNARFTALRVAYIVRHYKLRSRYDRLRDRGMLTQQEAAARLNIHEQTVTRWAKHGLITSHAYNGHYYLYELPASDLPLKHSSRWNRLVDRVAAQRQNASQEKPSTEHERDVV
jgi:DNA invertase Pin-like site-specific DNA recombinase